ncbi:HypC/HybG/HupF family hydrogenase formation chaperone [Azospirillum sp.]|uniref:HypC/HybG/HupF family hydrogenase formation chaperone n=1 Tax=Azospirillum sp. TaxID=34012 RepID=UPI00260C63AF|nr:HypC/HybG/HupF family hydrogenase formation chaperone [Azospirillum sp.]
MCLGLPMQVLESDGLIARCAGRGEERRVNVMLIDEVPVGGWVLVHMERAVRPLDEAEVGTLNDALDAILLAARGGDTDHLFADLLTRTDAPAPCDAP